MAGRGRPPPILGVLGPTASGKSGLALAAAEAVGGEVLAVDSMTVYRGLDVGTAKPAPQERARVPHHGLDLAEPTEPFTVARWLAEADRAIADARQRGVPIIAVGGTPMYWKALLEGLFEGPPADPAVRAALAGLSNEALRAELAAGDPESARRIHVNDRQRLSRAVEVLRLTGRPISQLQAEWDRGRRRHDVRLIGLRWDRPSLNRRINARAKQMAAAGWAEEVRGLLEKHGRLSENALDAAGYRPMLAHVAGRLPLADAVEQVKIKTRQLAVKQMRWFRRFENVTWLNGEAPADELLRNTLSAIGR